MACCVKIEPIRVDQWAGPWQQAAGFITTVRRRWSLFNSEADASPDNGQIRIRHDWDEAFEEIEYASLATYPEELKAESFEIQDGTYSLTMRVEFPDSEDCEDGEVENYQRYRAGTEALFRLRICSPATLKAVSVGEVSRFGFNRTGGIFDSPYQWFDSLDVSVSHSSEEVGVCSEDDFLGLPGSGGDWQRLLCGHEEAGGETCEMIERRDCGVASFCEGVRYLRVNIDSGDGREHVGGYYEITLTFECGESTLDCDEEEEHENYLPCNFGEFDPPCTPPVDPENPQPGECGGPLVIDEGECFCAECTVTGLLLHISGFADSACQLTGDPFKSLNSYASNMNGDFLLIPNGSGGFELDLGEPSDCLDRGILVAAQNATSVTHTCSSYINRIEATLGCSLDGDEPRWTASVSFYYATYDESAIDPCIPVLTCNDSGLDGTCINTVFNTEIGNVNGCNGSVTYSNGANSFYDSPPEGICNCYTDTEAATMEVEIIGNAGCPE